MSGHLGPTVLRFSHSRELIVAMPVTPPEGLAKVHRHCHKVVCLSQPEECQVVGPFHEDFTQVGDRQALDRLRAAEAERDRNDRGVLT